MTKSGAAIRVMTWNIHGGMGPDGRHDLERMLALVRRADPDILALQEVDLRRAAGAEHPVAMRESGSLSSRRCCGSHHLARWRLWPGPAQSLADFR